MQMPEAPGIFPASSELIFLIAGHRRSLSMSEMSSPHVAQTQSPAQGREDAQQPSVPLGRSSSCCCVGGKNNPWAGPRVGSCVQHIVGTALKHRSYPQDSDVPVESLMGSYSPKAQGCVGFSLPCSVKSPTRWQRTDLWVLLPVSCCEISSAGLQEGTNPRVPGAEWYQKSCCLPQDPQQCLFLLTIPSCPSLPPWTASRPSGCVCPFSLQMPYGAPACPRPVPRRFARV